MGIVVYNTLTRTKEPFEPVRPGKVGIYLCGPTVYKPSHVGHAVGPVIFDAIKRYLTFRGFEVTWVVNITDVDDKLIDEAARQNTTTFQLAERITGAHPVPVTDAAAAIEDDGIRRLETARIDERVHRARVVAATRPRRRGWRGAARRPRR